MKPIRRLPLLLVAALVGAAPALAATNAWQKVTTNNGVAVFRRDRDGTPMKEIRAVGRIDADCAKLEDIVADVRIFAKIIPYMSSSEVVSRAGDAVITHNVITLPTVSPRDVVVHLSKAESTTPDGRKVLDIRFYSVDGVGPAPDQGVVRMASLSGRARLVGRQDGSTDVEFRLYADPGGQIPAPLVNMATTRAAPMVINNLESVAQERQVANR